MRLRRGAPVFPAPSPPSSLPPSSFPQSPHPSASSPGPRHPRTPAPDAGPSVAGMEPRVPSRPVPLVALHLTGPHADAIGRFVDATPWQRTGGGPLRPDVRIVDVAGAERTPAPDDTPVLLVVDRGVDAVDAARATAVTGARAVVAWPGDRDRLVALVGGCAGRRPDPRPGILVAGAAGGVGTTTVTLALAGLAAWRGARVLALVHGDVPAPCGPAADGPTVSRPTVSRPAVSGPAVSRPVDRDALAGPGTWGAARPAAGLDRLRVLRTEGPVRREPVDAGAADLVVRDGGVGRDADVLVLRRDAAGLDALAATTAGTTVCVDAGVARRRALREAAGGRRMVVVDWSTRVARAGLARRVPTGLPGTWLRSLAGVLPDGGWDLHSPGRARAAESPDRP